MPYPRPETLTIIKYPDPRLKEVCEPVIEIDDDLRDLVSRMFELMREYEGIGLAAPQVGVLKRLFICNIGGDPKNDLVFINPVLEDFQGEAAADEGCLSIPDVTVKMRRAIKCKITGLNLSGEPVAFEGTELIARCWQHECDHLDGKLITDRMSQTDRIANRKALKWLEGQGR